LKLLFGKIDRESVSDVSYFTTAHFRRSQIGNVIEDPLVV
jgi:hypothetical protein